MSNRGISRYWKGLKGTLYLLNARNYDDEVGYRDTFGSFTADDPEQALMELGQRALDQNKWMQAAYNARQLLGED